MGETIKEYGVSGLGAKVSVKDSETKTIDFGELQEVGEIGSEIKTLEANTLLNKYVHKIPGREEISDVELTFLYDNTSEDSAWRKANEYFNTRAIKPWTITFEDGMSLVITGFITKTPLNGVTDDTIVFTVTICPTQKIEIKNPTIA